MSTILRLPESANDYNLSVTINKKLFPYLQAWFQRKRNDGETVEQFALRVLKASALQDYINDVVASQQQDFATDAGLLNTEVD